jgi:formylglycine-generating enzyme
MTNCGPGGSGNESCCTSLEVTNTGATPYYRTYTYGEGITSPSYADPATVSGFQLDKYLVTVGRFRQFVAAWNNGAGYYPSAGSGIHTHLNGGLGLANSGSPGTFEPGWDATDWNNTTDIDPTDTNLECESPYNTWTSTPNGQENLPINCANWWESYAFCIWDGGFLPSEAEWEYAAAGGSQQLEYPWGTMVPGTNNQYAIYNSYYTANPTYFAPVGYASQGAGYWGQFDLAGESFEWTLDWFVDYVDPCVDCAYLGTDSDPNPGRVIRGGYILGDTSFLLPPLRASDNPLARDPAAGFRCARTP